MPPLTEHVKATVLDSILTGRFPIGETIPSAYEIAQDAACSVGTVNLALLELAKEGVVRRIRRKGTVVVRHPRRYMGRVCLLQSADAHTNQLLVEPIFSELTRAGYTVDVVPASGDPGLTVERCESLRRQPDPAQTLISLFTPQQGRPAADPGSVLEAIHATYPRRIRFHDIPYVGLDPSAQWITVDWMEMARQVMEHLLRHGHRRIAVAAGLQPMENSPVGGEADFCRHLVEMAGGTVVPVYFSPPTYVENLATQFRRHSVTAYWAIQDHEALRAVNELQRAGVDVPGQISVVGRNDTPWCREVRPTLSTVSWDPPAVARAIAGTLQDIRGEKQPPANRALVVKPRLVVRDSSGPAP